MIKKKWTLLFLVSWLLFGAVFLFRLFSSLEMPAIDMVSINRIEKETAAQWERGTFFKPDSFPYDYTVADLSGAILLKTSAAAPETMTEAVRRHDTVLDLTIGQAVKGHVFIATGYDAALLKAKKELAFFAVLLLLLPLIPILIYTAYLNHAVLKPFRRMKDFTRHIAMGDLDFPLPMDRKHVFGAFTESFDIMRDQLREARFKEAEANRSKKELVASLSHDIKTPVASIKLTSELLLVTEKEAPVRERLQTIYQKSDQIDHLITNMLQASLDELGELTVNLSEASSRLVEAMIRDADYCGRISSFTLPGCILLIDPFRLEQVIGNILNNAYKYAGSDINVVSDLTEDGLRVEFMDYGKGVPDEELPSLFTKFFRGSNSGKKADGSGLGLYISKNLMERMGGIIECRNRSDGFSVILYLPLRHPGT